MTKNLKERIAMLQKEQEQLKAKSQQLQNRFNAEERKTTDKRKYIVGGLILKDIETNKALRDYITKCLASSPERTKNLFPEFFAVASTATQVAPKKI